MNEELRIKNEELTKGNKAIREYVNKFISKAILIKYRLNRFIKELIALFTYSLIPFRKSYAFTLAEVLITLGIIGVVAAMTIPTLVAKYQEKQAIVQLKKIYSELSQVNQALNFEYGKTWTVACEDFDNKCFKDLFASKIKTVKECDEDPVAEGCQAESKTLDGAERSTFQNTSMNYKIPSFISNNGYLVKFRFHNQGCERYFQTMKDADGNDVDKFLNCGWVMVDINGLKKPNLLGKDIFFLHFYNDGTIRPSTESMSALDRDDISKYKSNLTDDDIAAMKEDCYKGTGFYCAALYLLK